MAASVIVFDHPLSPYGQKVKIALMEKGVAFDAPLPGNIGSGNTGGDFARVSPRGEVPALVDGEVAVFDSTVILEYIEDRWPEPPLLPALPAERARVRMLEEAMDTHFEAITWGMSEIRNFGRANGALAEAMLAKAGEQIADWYRWLEAQLGDRPWFNGAAFGWGDLSVVPYVNGASGFGHRPAQGSRLAEWLARANQRQSVAACAKAAAAVGFDSAAVSLEAVRQAMEQGLFKREYRDHRLEWMVKTGGIEIVQAGLAKGNIRFIDPFPV
ncbi:MAG: glutathione S-transferase family protein [Pseudomonadales bacterium]|nr:glutathione S-transferase family protein [Pseudomonadales bacterium]